MKSTAMKLIILGLAVSLLLTLWIGSALAASYDLWVGGVRVTDSNKANILGDGTAQYDPSTATLTLNNAHITNTYGGNIIYAEGINLTITGSANLEGDASVTHAIFSLKNASKGGSLTIKGNITAKALNMSACIYAHTNIIISGATVEATGGSIGMDAEDSIYITDSTVTASGSHSGIVTESTAQGNIEITNSKVTATGDKYGLRGNHIKVQGNSRVEATSTDTAVCSSDEAVKLDEGLLIIQPVGGEPAKIIKEGGVIAKHVVISKVPIVTGLKAHVTGTELSDGVYKIKADSLEAFFKDTKTSVTMSAYGLYTTQETSVKLNTPPVPGAAYYFMVTADAYDDQYDTPTLVWAENDVFKAGSDISADNADVEIVDISHGPQGGSITLIVKYIEKAQAASKPAAAPTNVPRTGDGAKPMLWLGLVLLGLLGLGGYTVIRHRK